MDFKVQNNQPQTQPASSRAANQGSNRDGGRKMVAIAISAFVAIVLIVGAVLLWQGTGKASGNDNAAIEKEGYQALFMTNGQVYFGRLSNLDGGYAQLTDVYYLQVQQTVQPAAESKDNEQPKVSLTKLGNELHGPKDKMHISKDQILFWENLKDDSTVVKAIKDYKAKQ